VSDVRLESVDATTRSIEFADACLVAETGDQSTVFAAVLSRVGKVSGLWWRLHDGYSPALVARDIATLSHIGEFEVVVVDGPMSAEAAEVIQSLLTGEPVTRDTPFGSLVSAINRPQPPRALRILRGERTKESHGRLVL
jgi:hypothetical protein